MAFRKLTAKKYNGILEYFNPNSKDKETRALYVSIRDELGKTTKVKLNTLDLTDAILKLTELKNLIQIR